MKYTVNHTVLILTVVLGLGLELTAVAQPLTEAAPAHGSAQSPAASDDLEPAVATSGPHAAVALSAGRSQPSAEAAVAVPSAATTDAAGARRPSAGGTAKSADTKEVGPRGRGAAGKQAGGTGSTDRLELGTTEISGNRELPKVLYVVPWRRPDPGDTVGRPPNSLVEEALTPVDRDVFQRQNHYYAALESSAAAGQPAAAGAGAGAAARAAGHK